MGRRHSVHHLIDQWHDVRRSTVFDILMSVAFTDAQFLSCLLDPNTEEFHHVLPHGYRNPYLATPGKNIHGILLAGVCKAIISVATQLHHFLHHPYVVPDLGHIYLGRSVSLDLIPSVAGAIHLLHYPSPLVEQNIPIPPPTKHPRFIQEAPECTDVWLRDNPALVEEWRTSQNKAFPPLQPNKSVTPEISQLVTPLLELDITPAPTSEVSVVPMEISDNTKCKSVLSLLGMNLMPTCMRVQEVASAFTSTSSAQMHQKYFCPICAEQVNRIKSHVVEVHLPYYVNIEAACFICEHNYGTASNLLNHVQVQHSDRHGHIAPGATLATTYAENKYLHLITYFLNYLLQSLELSTVSDLLSTLLKSPEEMPKSTWAPWLQWYKMKATATELYLMGQLSNFLHTMMPKEVQLMPPNCIVALSHWRLLTTLIKLLPSKKHGNLKSVNSLCNGNGILVSEIPTIEKPVLDIIDTHMHLDKFMANTGHNDIDMERLPSMKCCPTPVANLLFYVVNNAFLSSDLKRWELTPKMITDPKAKICYSIHPKQLANCHLPNYNIYFRYCVTIFYAQSLLLK